MSLKEIIEKYHKDKDYNALLEAFKKWCLE